MKRIFVSLLMLAVCLCCAVALNITMKVFYKNGSVFTFLKPDIESITYSKMDLDGIVHPDYVVQEITTADTVYRMPLAEIDSVTFSSICPDDNHHHAIDLGLPSGTKWCCHNVCATSPADFGKHYAWGETSQKDGNYHYTYKYFCLNNTEDEWGAPENYIDIGSDIAGTEYDVAHVVMGEPWQMPTVEQVNELLECCSWQYKLVAPGYVGGYLVTGPNGAQIFIPAAGYREDAYVAGACMCGSYWTSSLNLNRASEAYMFGFGAGTPASISSTYRFRGYSVRPVCR